MQVDMARKMVRRQALTVVRELESKDTVLASLPTPYKGRQIVISIDKIRKSKEVLMRFFEQRGGEWVEIPKAPAARCKPKHLEDGLQKMYLFFANMGHWYADPVVPKPTSKQ